MWPNLQRITVLMVFTIQQHSVKFSVKLVGGRPIPLKNEFVNWDDDIPN